MNVQHQSETGRSSQESLYEVDSSSLFNRIGVAHNIRAVFSDSTYEFDPVPEANWLYPAFRGFQKLQEQRQERGTPVRSFATIGTGPGLDAVGASHIFRPEQLIVTDREREVLPIAKENVRKNMADPAAEVIALHGDLCQPLRDNGLRVDVAYGNLPLLPVEGDIKKMDAATYMSQALFDRAPLVYKKYRLAMIHALLTDSRSSLAENGSLVVALGGRVPELLIKDLFDECRYSYNALFTMLKRQTQPELVLPGFADAEDNEGAAFDFYRYDQARNAVPLEAGNLSVHQYKQLLHPYRVGAGKGMELHARGEPIGHVVQIIEGQPLA